MSIQVHVQDKPYRPVTSSEVINDTIGEQLEKLFGASIGSDPLTVCSDVWPNQDAMRQQTNMRLAISVWSEYCREMAFWYQRQFALDPLILISMPSAEMCERYRLPHCRDFIVQTLRRIIGYISHDRPVDIVDCEHDPLTDPQLAAQAGYWVQNFPSLVQNAQQVLCQESVLIGGGCHG